MLKKKVRPKLTMPKTVAEKRAAARAQQLERVLRAFVAAVDNGSYRGCDLVVIEDWLTHLSTRLKQIYELSGTSIGPKPKRQKPVANRP